MFCGCKQTKFARHWFKVSAPASVGASVLCTEVSTGHPHPSPATNIANRFRYRGRKPGNQNGFWVRLLTKSIPNRSGLFSVQKPVFSSYYLYKSNIVFDAYFSQSLLPSSACFFCSSSILYEDNNITLLQGRISLKCPKNKCALTNHRRCKHKKTDHFHLLY